MKTALTIAGSDPTGGAGFQADLRTFQSLGVYGLSVPSVLTAQNTSGVHSIHELTAEFVSEQLDVLLKDITPDAVKTGMLYSAEIISAVAAKIKQYSLRNLVIDPVTVSSTGVRLLEEKGLDVLKNSLFPLAAVVTPNIYEASVLAGKEIRTEGDMKEAAVRLRGFGPDAVIITGGHLEGSASDLLFDGSEFFSIGNERLEGEFQGTGCVFSSVMTACLAQGHGVKESFIRAKEFVLRAIRDSVPIGRGMRILKTV
ncbi:MAG: bifunctional hydroxymethylpyrimidine kinase/phosphomethylpyrimidine kinase [Nitrospirota bacterium]|nr:bifunctional hydroxymethylpyrimidine kinase/phosphomethylpyrimidine kinase [Nitrospirota bacterium]